MSGNWKLTLPCTRADAEYMSGDVPELAMLEPAPTFVASEPDEFAPDAWEIAAYFAGKPDPDTVKLIHSLVKSAAMAKPHLEQLPDEDWVTMSQAALQPVHAGRFFVHTSSFDGVPPPGTTPLVIDAGQAFGTGGHDTTEGCLALIDSLRRKGQRFAHIADIGTGTGILAFAAHHLWPRARIVASDIDPVSVRYAKGYADTNRIPVGRAVGQVALVTASGTDHPLIRRRAPYDLVIANILAGPLIELAPSIAVLAGDGSVLVLAGLLGKQKDAVIAAYRAYGYRLGSISGSSEWPTLHLIKRTQHGFRRKIRATGRTSQPPGDFGTW
jgi:ribosomal protein L11 methyltransferase